MFDLLVKLMLISALAEAGTTAKDILTSDSRTSRAKIERASRHVLNIDWKPISVWPKEAERLK